MTPIDSIWHEWDCPEEGEMCAAFGTAPSQIYSIGFIEFPLASANV